MDFLERLKKLQTDLNMNQKEFANALEITPSALSVMLKGKTKPSLKTIEAICHICYKNKISLEWIMLGEEKKELSKEDRELLTAYHNAKIEAKEIVKFTLEISRKTNKKLEGEKSSITKTG